MPSVKGELGEVVGRRVQLVGKAAPTALKQHHNMVKEKSEACISTSLTSAICTKMVIFDNTFEEYNFKKD